MQMITRMRLAATVLLASLSMGCASIRMEPAQFRQAAAPGKALVTFVRPKTVFPGGPPIDLWDGAHFIGGLMAGAIIQYEVTPGEHLFMARSDQNWSYASGAVVEGKRYYIKTNFSPGFLAAHVSLGIADRLDLRIEEWETLKATASPEAARVKFESANQPEVQKRIQKFRDGDVRVARITDKHAF